MERLLKFIGAILLLFIVIVIFLYIQINTYSKVINLNWSIKLPNSYKEIYSANSGASFHGDGQRYHIFEYNNENEINQALNWINAKNVSMELEINKILNNLNVSKQNMPDYNKKYKYYVKFQEDSSKIYLIFVPDTRKLYIIEDIY
ncbi:hypothetical protein ACAG39_05155 [Caldicellulosiruptoraceae bacterium PP1]